MCFFARIGAVFSPSLIFTSCVGRCCEAAALHLTPEWHEEADMGLDWRDPHHLRLHKYSIEGQCSQMAPAHGIPQQIHAGGSDQRVSSTVHNVDDSKSE